MRSRHQLWVPKTEIIRFQGKIRYARPQTTRSLFCGQTAPSNVASSLSAATASPCAQLPEYTAPVGEPILTVSRRNPEQGLPGTWMWSLHRGGPGVTRASSQARRKATAQQTHGAGAQQQLPIADRNGDQGKMGGGARTAEHRTGAADAERNKAPVLANHRTRTGCQPRPVRAGCQ